MKNKKLAALVIAGATTLGLATTTLAAPDTNTAAPQGHQFTHASFTAVRTALESGTYAEWAELVDADHPLAGLITEANFPRFQEMHQAMQDGDTETAEAIRTELGLPAAPARSGQHCGSSADTDSSDTTGRPCAPRGGRHGRFPTSTDTE